MTMTFCYALAESERNLYVHIRSGGCGTCGGNRTIHVTPEYECDLLLQPNGETLHSISLSADIFASAKLATGIGAALDGRARSLLQS